MKFAYTRIHIPYKPDLVLGCFGSMIPELKLKPLGATKIAMKKKSIDVDPLRAKLFQGYPKTGSSQTLRIVEYITDIYLYIIYHKIYSMSYKYKNKILYTHIIYIYI